jgi:hypothetical protein
MPNMQGPSSQRDRQLAMKAPTIPNVANQPKAHPLHDLAGSRPRR